MSKQSGLGNTTEKEGQKGFVWRTYEFLPHSTRERISFIRHHYKFPGKIFNPGKFENAWLYFTLCKWLRPVTYLRRLWYARSLARKHPDVTVDPSIGYAFITPDVLPEIREVAEKARKIFQRMNVEYLKDNVKKPFMIEIPAGELEKDLSTSPFLDLGLNPVFVAPVAKYLGMLPILHDIRFLYSPNVSTELSSSQKFHIDQEDYKQIKVFLYVDEVTEDSGPLCVLPVDETRRVHDGLRRDHRTNRRNKKLEDDVVFQYTSPDNLKPITVPSSTAAIVDTASCMHYGSRPGNKPRLAILFRYVTPFSNILPWKWKKSEHLAFGRVPKKPLTDMQKRILGRK